MKTSNIFCFFTMVILFFSCTQENILPQEKNENENKELDLLIADPEFEKFNHLHFEYSKEVISLLKAGETPESIEGIYSKNFFALSQQRKKLEEIYPNFNTLLARIDEKQIQSNLRPRASLFDVGGCNKSGLSDCNKGCSFSSDTCTRIADTRQKIAECLAMEFVCLMNCQQTHCPFR